MVIAPYIGPFLVPVWPGSFACYIAFGLDSTTLGNLTIPSTKQNNITYLGSLLKNILEALLV